MHNHKSNCFAVTLLLRKKKNSSKGKVCDDRNKGDLWAVWALRLVKFRVQKRKVVTTRMI